jgi:hypothetical protein
MSISIIKAVKDRNLFWPYMQGREKSLRSWHNWLIALRVIYGLPVRRSKNLELIRQCTGRDPSRLPSDGFRTVLLLVGRRGGKSKISGLIGAYEGLFSGREKYLSPGEIGMVTITSPTREQSKIIKSYCRAALGAPILDAEVGDDVREGFPLSNGVRVRILTGDYQRTRGFTQLAVICDEICFFGVTEESRVKSDTELIRSIKPALLTTKGPLICVSTKYAPRGWAYGQHKRHFGSDGSRTLVWDATSRTMNPTLSQADIDAEMEDDPEAARAEYLNEWREDVAMFLPREVIEAVVVKGRKELLPRPGTRYAGFVDISGGRNDSAALAIAHRDGTKVIIDFIREFKPPFSPYAVAGDMSMDLARYNLKMVTGDRYSAEFVVQAFRNHVVIYRTSDLNKSQLYLELLPRICSREIELLDNDKCITQLSGLERRCRSGGNDVVDHMRNEHDDLANAIAGVVSILGKPVFIAGGWNLNTSKGTGNVTLNRRLLATALAAQR